MAEVTGGCDRTWVAAGLGGMDVAAGFGGTEATAGFGGTEVVAGFGGTEVVAGFGGTEVTAGCGVAELPAEEINGARETLFAPLGGFIFFRHARALVRIGNWVWRNSALGTSMTTPWYAAGMSPLRSVP